MKNNSPIKINWRNIALLSAIAFAPSAFAQDTTTGTAESPSSAAAP